MRRPPVSIWPPEALALARQVEAAGWPSRLGDAPERGVRSIALVDARESDEAARLRLAATTAAVRLVLVSAVDPAVQDRLIDAGATQIAVVDDRGVGLAPALRLATVSLSIRTDRRLRRPAAPAMERWVEQRLADGLAVAVIRIAIVRLDLVNAAHGRDGGTALVAAAERRIATQVAAVTPDDGSAAGEEASTLVARGDGADIVVALVASADRVVLCAARIEEALAVPFRLDGRRAVLGTRLGLASARPGDTAGSLIARAAPPGASTDAAGEGDDTLAIDIHRALAGDEIAILYQPQAPLAGGAPTGVEALARWQHPARGTLGAEALLAAAARAGIGTALSDHIQRRILADVAAWPAALAGLHVALNLTAADLARPGFVEVLLARIDASGVQRRRLTLEVTETELMSDLDLAAGVLAALQSAGCRTAIDDFGTGYSSLAYLASLPIDYLKLDRALACEIVGPERGQVVVRAAIEMGRRLGVAVVAEGVETEAQRVELAQAGCTLYQGFLLAPPLSGEELAVMMTAR